MLVINYFYTSQYFVKSGLFMEDADNKINVYDVLISIAFVGLGFPFCFLAIATAPIPQSLFLSTLTLSVVPHIGLVAAFSVSWF